MNEILLLFIRLLRWEKKKTQIDAEAKERTKKEIMGLTIKDPNSIIKNRENRRRFHD